MAGNENLDRLIAMNLEGSASVKKAKEDAVCKLFELIVPAPGSRNDESTSAATAAATTTPVAGGGATAAPPGLSFDQNKVITADSAEYLFNDLKHHAKALGIIDAQFFNKFKEEDFNKLKADLAEKNKNILLAKAELFSKMENIQALIDLKKQGILKEITELEDRKALYESCILAIKNVLNENLSEGDLKAKNMNAIASFNKLYKSSFQLKDDANLEWGTILQDEEEKQRNLEFSIENKRKQLDLEKSNDALEIIINQKNQLDTLKASLEANKQPEAAYYEEIRSFQSIQDEFTQAIEQYNAKAEPENKIMLPAPPQTPPTRGISTGWDVKANIKGFIGKNTREWTGELLVDIARISELTPVASTAPLAIASSPPTQKLDLVSMSLEQQERHVLSRTFEEVPGHSDQNHVGMLVQEPDGKVVNHSKNLTQEEMKFAAMEMAQLFVRNYRPPAEIKITGKASDAGMAQMVHQAVKEMLPKAKIKNNVPGGEPSSWSSPLSDVKTILKDIIDEVKPDIEAAQAKYEKVKTAQAALKKGEDGLIWGLGKSTDQEKETLRKQVEEAEKEAKGTDLEGNEAPPPRAP